MKHPNQEQWISFLYGELTEDERSELSAHLSQCPECGARVSQWRSTQRKLDAWQIPIRKSKRVLNMLKWAAAAVILLGVGYSVGRSYPPPLDLKAVRAAIEPSLRRELAEELDRSLASRLSTQSQSIYDAFTALDARYATTAVSLKQDIDTVALLTEASFRRTEAQLVQLADSTQPVIGPIQQ